MHSIYTLLFCPHKSFVMALLLHYLRLLHHSLVASPVSDKVHSRAKPNLSIQELI